MNLTKEEQKIISNLPHGEANAITYKTLSWRTGIPEREVSQIVSHLVEIHHVCICTNSSSGYFLASCFDEYEHAYKELISRAKSLSRRARGLRFGWEKDGLHFEQMGIGGM